MVSKNLGHCHTRHDLEKHHKKTGMQFNESHHRSLIIYTIPVWAILLLKVILAFAGCVLTPDVYTMRSEISTIGVYLSPEQPKTEVFLPAKGVWIGLKRGIVVGASLPVMIGFVSPIPGGTFVGLLVSPFGALIGGVYGIFTAVPAKEVEHAEVILAMATEKIRYRAKRMACAA